MAITWGATYSIKYAHDLGLDWQKTFISLLVDFPFKKIRLCGYWDLLEPQEGRLQTGWLDWLIQKAKDQNIKIVLSLGRKVPRWPEYHDPQWALTKDQAFLENSYLDFLPPMIERYKNIVDEFQIENEPLFPFGQSKFPLTSKFLAQELKLVKELTKKPIIITDSGEQGKWNQSSQYGDKLGINLYSIVYDSKLNHYHHYNLHPYTYTFKKLLINKPVFVAELQAEPWGPGTMMELMKNDEWTKSMNAHQLAANVNKAKKAGFKEIWFWGIEWWKLVENNTDEITRTVNKLMAYL